MEIECRDMMTLWQLWLWYKAAVTLHAYTNSLVPNLPSCHQKIELWGKGVNMKYAHVELSAYIISIFLLVLLVVENWWEFPRLGHKSMIMTPCIYLQYKCHWTVNNLRVGDCAHAQWSPHILMTTNLFMVILFYW